jgi:nicotinate-nucleotide--dimethylbenzimidazole phosphoribosyltransferase
LRSFDIAACANAPLEQAVITRWNSLTKPAGSLGRLEQLVLTLALQQGRARPMLAQRSIYIFCGDHGVTAQGVSAYPSEVTRQMMLNFVTGGAAINTLCRAAGIPTVIVDAGVKGAPVAGVIAAKIAEGTQDFSTTAAMTREQARQAVETGAELAHSTERDDIRGVGEMGIGNTTSAAALLCAFTGLDPQQAAGPGTGLPAAGVALKAEVIARALALHQPKAADPLGVLAQLGGFEIAMMAGFLLGCAERRIPVMMDGFITCAAALVATRMMPAVNEYLIYSHRSAEPAHHQLLAELGGKPLLDLGMRLGEGTGAALGISLAVQALALYDGMATFEEASVSTKRMEASGGLG